MASDVEHPLQILGRRVVDWVSREELEEKIRHSVSRSTPLRIKYGADPSAPDLHLGHVVGLNKLREFQDLGHIVVFIIGDFTGMIGDPSGRSATRKPLSRDEIQANAETYKDQVFRILDPERTEVRYNSEWFSPMAFDEVIRLSAKVTVAQMLARDDFSRRHATQQPISLVEFLYPLIQAYDSVQVRADVELGGTDQLFNLLLGREIQKAHEQAPQVAMTLPLLEGLDGVQKMSKSLNNYVGVTEPPGEMFGKIMSVNDDIMWRYWELVVCEDEDRIRKRKANVEAGIEHPKAVKDELARRIVSRFHGEDAARQASESFEKVFSKGERPDEMPEATVPTDAPGGRFGLLALVVHAGLAPSNGAARRLIAQGAVRVNDAKITDPHAEVVWTDGDVLRVGRRGFARIRVG